MGFDPLPTLRSGPWSLDDVQHFLEQTAIPIRLASNGRGFPLVQSQWFLYEDGALWCCAQADSVLAKRLTRDPRCAFEVSGDLPPYRGVRGTGHASQHADEAPRIEIYGKVVVFQDRYGNLWDLIEPTAKTG